VLFAVNTEFDPVREIVANVIAEFGRVVPDPVSSRISSVQSHVVEASSCESRIRMMTATEPAGKSSAGAPRVVVVGDDKQCAPSDSRLGRSLQETIDSQYDHLAELRHELRLRFTPKSNLYDLLAALSGTEAVVRLRERFRCIPEIINWSAAQFYSDGDGASSIIPLRERTAGDLDPLVLEPVKGGRCTSLSVLRMLASTTASVRSDFFPETVYRSGTKPPCTSPRSTSGCDALLRHAP
jgi:hypothetical protein